MQRRNFPLFVVPPVLQGNDSISRSGLLFLRASARTVFGGSFSAKTGVLRKQNPGFGAARSAIEHLLKRFSRFGCDTRRFLMARARIIFRGTEGNSGGDFGSASVCSGEWPAWFSFWFSGCWPEREFPALLVFWAYQQDQLIFGIGIFFALTRDFFWVFSPSSGGVFVLLGGVFVLLGCFFSFRASAQGGNSPLCLA